MNTKFNINTIETDVLVIGGGGAGCTAAIKAAEEGADVTIAEKANIIRSGQNGTGVDHMWAWIPEVHGEIGWTIEDLVEDHYQLQAFGLLNKEIVRKITVESYNRVLDLESYGIQFRYDDSPVPGKWRVVPQFHSIISSLNFDGRNFKPILAKEAEKRGVRVVNRVMMTDLIVTDGRVTGALGVSTRSHDIYYFKTKSVILSTGRAGRLTRNVTGTDFNLPRQPGQVGDGKIMALNAGCRLINMEAFGRRFLNIGPYHQSTGSPRSTTWPSGSLVAQDGKIIIPRSYFTTWSKYIGPDKQKIDFAARRQKILDGIKNWPSTMDNHLRGEGPFYLDCTVGSEEENDYVVWSWIHEGKGWLFIRHLEEEGWDINKDLIEFTMNNAQMGGGPAAGVLVDNDLETGVGGLYVAGDEMGGIPWASSQVAVGTGWFTGSMAAEFAKKEGEFQPVDEDRLESLIERCTKIRDNEAGVPWKEVERSVQDIVDTYRGDVVTDQTLKRGIERIHDVRDNVYLKADNPHELMRCLEAQSLIQNAEYVLRASIERKETRILPLQFIRTDYPEQDDENFHAWIVMTLENGDFKFTKLMASEINPE